jgi:hypothetical protein
MNRRNSMNPKWIAMAVCFVSGLANANVCEPSSAEMATFQSQIGWKAVNVGEGPSRVSGFVDEKGNFRMGSLARSGSFPVKLTIPSSNPGYKTFMKACRKGDAADLLDLREGKVKNTYRLEVRYLADMSQLPNDPWKEQSYRVHTIDPRLKISADSLTAENEVNVEVYRLRVGEKIAEQFRNQKTHGVFSIDLSGQDDLVCDLIQGKASLFALLASGYIGPMVEKRQVVADEVFPILYKSLKAGVPETDRDARLFFMGRTVGQLEANKVLNAQQAWQSLAWAKRMHTPDLSALLDLSAGQLQCLADQAQLYQFTLQSDSMRVDFAFPELGKEQAE